MLRSHQLEALQKIRNCKSVFLRGVEYRKIPKTGCLFVSSNGKIYSSLSKRFRKYRKDKDGYLRLNCFLNGKHHDIRVHHAVLIAWNRNKKDGEQARHLDGNKFNNKIDNLRWGTPKQNHQDRRRHGTNFAGERHPKSKLTDKIVKFIRGSSLTIHQIHKKFNFVTINCLRHVRYFKSWRHV